MSLDLDLDVGERKGDGRKKSVARGTRWSEIPKRQVTREPERCEEVNGSEPTFEKHHQLHDLTGSQSYPWTRPWALDLDRSAS